MFVEHSEKGRTDKAQKVILAAEMDSSMNEFLTERAESNFL